MFLLFVILAILAIHKLLQFCQFVYRQYRLYLKLRDVPGPEIKLALFGNIALLFDLLRHKDGDQLSTRFTQTMLDLCQKYGDTEHGLIRLWFGPFVPMVIVSNPRTAQTLMSNAHFLDKSKFYTLFSLAVGNGIFTCNANKWRVQKKYLLEHFKYRALESYIDQTKPHLDNFMKCIDQCVMDKDGDCDNIEMLISNFVFDALGDNLFSTKFKAQFHSSPRNSKIVHELLKETYKAFLKPWTLFFDNIFLRYLLNISLIKKIFKNLFIFKKATKKLVMNRYQRIIEKGASSKAKHIPLLDSMILARLEKTKLTKLYQIESQANTFIIAGHDTTTSSLTWALYLLGHHLEVQQKMQAEIDAYLDELRDKNESITLLNLKRLKYVEACIKETLRLYPSGPFVGRQAQKDIDLGEGVCMPAGVEAIIFVYHYHRSEKYFREPLRFYPERFLAEHRHPQEDLGNGPSWYNKTAFMPFSAGQRMCIGKEYGLLQQKLFLIHLLSRYELQANDKYGSIEPKFDFLLSSANFPVTFHKRRRT